MPRKPESTRVLLLKGKKHLTKAEIEARLEAESLLRIDSDKVKCPSWLDDEAKKEWRRLVPELKSLELLTNVDVTSLAIYCDAVSKYISAPDDARLKWAQVIRQYLAEFGLSPSARLKLRPPEKKEKPKSEFDKKFGDV